MSRENSSKDGSIANTTNADLPESLPSATKHRVLRMLNDGRFHSGEAIAEQLGISRAAVGKHVSSLKALGLDIFGVTGKGYRLRQPVEFLSAEQVIQSGKFTGDFPTPLILPSVNSTNQYLMDRISKLASGQVCLAEAQTQGRGRRGRSWLSPFGANIYCSLYWQLDGGLSKAMGLSLIVGLAIRDALVALGVERVSLKWPNDVLRQGRKLAGILVELEGDADSECQIIIGFGLNYRMPEHVSGEIDQPWIDLQTGSKDLPGRNHIAGAVISRLIRYLQTYQQTGFQAFQECWSEADHYYNQPVTLTIGNQLISGVCRGVNEYGALMLDSNGQTKPFYGGEISLRPVK